MLLLGDDIVALVSVAMNHKRLGDFFDAKNYRYVFVVNYAFV